MATTATATTDPPPAPTAAYRLPAGPVAAEEDAPAQAPASDRAALLRQNAEWFRRLRWIVVATLVAASALVARFPGLGPALGLALTPGWPLVLALILALCNLAYARLAAGDRVAPGIQVGVQIAADLVLLTLVIHLSGGGLTFLATAYLFHIILACLVFPSRQSLAVLLAAAALLVSSLALGRMGLGPALAGGGPAALPLDALAARSATLLGAWVVTWYLVSRLAAALRRREDELAATNRRLEASGAERMRHMIQTTHQLKAPFAAIHAQAQLLTGGACGPLTPEARHAAGRIAERARLLAQQIHDMLQLANLRSESQAPPPRREIDLAATLDAVAGRLAPAAGLRGITIATDLAPARVVAAEDRLRMLLDNLVENAVTYSRDGGTVTLRLRPADAGGAVVSVADEGIGIPADRLPLVFDDYYRTREAAQHNPASTGLGLAIVRDAARAEHIAVDVASAPGRGTAFTLLIPSRAAGTPAAPGPAED